MIEIRRRERNNGWKLKRTCRTISPRVASYFQTITTSTSREGREEFKHLHLLFSWFTGGGQEQQKCSDDAPAMRNNTLSVDFLKSSTCKNNGSFIRLVIVTLVDSTSSGKWKHNIYTAIRTVRTERAQAGEGM